MHIQKPRSFYYTGHAPHKFVIVASVRE